MDVLLPQQVVQIIDIFNVIPREVFFLLLSLLSQVQIFEQPINIPLSFDYVVVGGGIGGCVVASRLSEDPGTTVLLLEAGGEANVFTRVPSATFSLWDSVYDWKYRSVPQKYTAQYLNDRVVKLPAGKVLGGGSMLNALLWVRGTKYDFQRWSDIGIRGWSYEENLPYFIKSESLQIASLAATSTRRGFAGPVVVSYSSYQSKVAQGLINAGGARGYRTDYDYNDKYRLGFARVQSDLLAGLRYDAARAYINPIRGTRSNLLVAAYATATKVLFHEKRAIGVVFERFGQQQAVYATKEVIIAAGGVGSPKLLLLSGVGPRRHLKEVGIQQIHESAVGQNLQDHQGSVASNWCLKGNELIDFATGFTPNNVSISSPAAGFTNFIDWTAFINTKTGPHNVNDFPDIQYMGIEVGANVDFGAWLWRDLNIRKDVWEKTYAPIYFQPSTKIIVVVLLLDYKTRGEVRLASSDPHEAAIVDIQYLSHPEERETMIRGHRFLRELFASQQMVPFDPQFLNVPLPNCSFPNDVNSDGYLDCLTRGIPTTIFHYSSTMRIGADNDPSAVVDSQLRVKGLTNIRVVDTSVLPFLPSGNPQATNYMVAEKAADIIKGRGMLPPIHVQA